MKVHDAIGGRRRAFIERQHLFFVATAPLSATGHITVMFCAFDGAPNIVRLHGVGRYLTLNDADFASHRSRFGDHPGARGIVVVDVERVSDSYGYAVPNLAFENDREVLDAWAQARGEVKLAAYHHERNTTSIDGLPALPVD